jgi:hypothetical protein
MNEDEKKLNTCGCCEGVEFLTPTKMMNDAGLTELLFRVGTHSTFKTSMLRHISELIPLKTLTTRDNDDHTIALIDAWAVLLDVLTFYQERLINEGYLRTSSEQLSLVELARHLGYRPKPGVAAAAWLAFMMDESPGAPAEAKIPIGTKIQSIPGQDENPQVFETTEKILAKTSWNTIRPRLTRTQIFTNGLTHLYLEGTDTRLSPGDYLLIVGEERLIDAGSIRWDIRKIETVSLNAQENYTLITWREILLGYTSTFVKVYVFRQRAHFFGYNAPDFRMMPEAVKRSFDKDYDPDNPSNSTEWPGYFIKSTESMTVHLDAFYPKILPYGWMILMETDHQRLYQVERNNPSSQKNFSLSAKTSKVQLQESKQIENPDYTIDLAEEILFGFDRRQTLVLAQSEELPLAEEPIFTPVFGTSIQLEENQPDLQIDQYLICSGQAVSQVEVIYKAPNIGILLFTPIDSSGETTSLPLKTGEILEIIAPPKRTPQNKILWGVKREGIPGYVIAEEKDIVPYLPEKEAASPALATSLDQAEVISEVVQIKAIDANCQTLDLHSALTNVYLRPTFKINANVAEATHGESKMEVLGSGDGRKAFQKFWLKQKPLTYVSATSASGAESTLEVRVNDILWQETPTLYGQKPEENVFITNMEDDGTVSIQFGDGITGARLPSGAENIRASFRVGIGMGGKLKANQLSLLLTPPMGVNSVTNPLPTTNAEEPEKLESIRQNAPLTVLTLDRIVSIQDYTHFANAFAGIGKAQARLLWKGSNRVVHLTVAGADGGAIDLNLHKNLKNAIESARQDRFPIVIQPFDLQWFQITARIKIVPSFNEDKVITQVRKMLKATFSFSARSFGQSVTSSEVMTLIQSINGVMAVSLDLFKKVDTDAPSTHRIKAYAARLDEHHLLSAQLLLLDTDRTEIITWKNEDQ